MIFPNFQNFKFAMGERFAFAAEEEINQLVDKAVVEKHERSTFDGKVF